MTESISFLKEGNLFNWVCTCGSKSQSPASYKNSDIKGKKHLEGVHNQPFDRKNTNPIDPFKEAHTSGRIRCVKCFNLCNRVTSEKVKGHKKTRVTKRVVLPMAYCHECDITYVEEDSCNLRYVGED